MGYKGEDLDLRSPLARGRFPSPAPMPPPSRGSPGVANQFPAGRAYHHLNAGPIWADDVLMACCNHAFDVASAHRAAEVRIEHLLYAITRVDAASEVLEKHGVQDAGLRRESAMIIASALPVGTLDARQKSQASAALRETLQLANNHALASNRAAGVADILYTLTALRPHLPGADLLTRHLTAPISNSSPPKPSTQTAQMDHTISSKDLSQDQRIERLEGLIYSLTGQTPPPGYYQPPPQPFPQAPPAPTAPPTATGYPAPNGQTGVIREIEQLESGLVSRLEHVAQYLARLDERISSMEQALGSDKGGTSLDLGRLSERIGDLEALLRERDASSTDLTGVETRLNDIEVALLSQEPGGEGRGNLGEQFEDLRESFAHSLDDLRHAVNERIDKVSENSSAQFTAVHDAVSAQNAARDEANAALGAEVKALAGASVTHAASAERNINALKEGLNAVGELVTKIEQDNVATRNSFIEELREVHDAIMKLNANQHTMADSITNWHQDHTADNKAASERLAAIEDNTARPLDEIQIMSASVAQLSADMNTMYRTTVERYHRRNRFWFWLFGTDDWIGASWPSQTARIEAELRAVKRMSDK